MRSEGNDWYRISDIENIDSPALVIYKDSVIKNISTAIAMVDDIKRLRPHVKTNKCSEAVQLMMDAGINKFKCATIAEAEMLGMIQAADVLLAYQPVGPKLKRFIMLIKKYSQTKFSCLVDNVETAKIISGAAKENDLQINVYIDINIGMNRSGAAPEKVSEIYHAINNLSNIKVAGLHVYDGHFRSPDFENRKIDCDNAFTIITDLQQQLKEDGFNPIIIAGGSPTFPIHAKRKEIECSPGTFVYWDRNYQQSCKEQQFLTAALVISRVISLPGETKICLDLGHKSIASENELPNRVFFLNAPDLKFISQSEEHLVAEAPVGHNYKPGDVLYGLPFHICPTVALYERALVIENKLVCDEWKTIARDRKITI